MKYFFVFLTLITCPIDAVAQANHHKNEQVKSILQTLDSYREIQSAFDAGNKEKARELLRRLEENDYSNTFTKEPTDIFQLHISRGELELAKEVLAEGAQTGALSLRDRILLHNTLGNAYLERDELEGALNEYKTILQLMDR